MSELQAVLEAHLDEADLELAYARKIGKPGYAEAHLEGMIHGLRKALADSELRCAECGRLFPTWTYAAVIHHADGTHTLPASLPNPDKR